MPDAPIPADPDPAPSPAAAEGAVSPAAPDVAGPAVEEHWFRQYRLPLAILGAHFLLFFAARIALVLLHRQDFQVLSAGEMVGGFLRGFRFDAAIILLFLIIPVGLLMLPFPWSRTGWWVGIWGWISWGIFVVFALVLSVDVIYFGYVHRHLGPEVTFISSAFQELNASAFLSYILPMIGFLVAVAALFVGWRRLLRLRRPVAGSLALRIAVFVVAGLAMYAGSRGTLNSKRLKVVHAFTGGPAAGAYLSLNGPFTTLHSLEELNHLKADFYPMAQAIATVQGGLIAPSEKRDGGDEYPLVRRRTPKPGPKPNVVLIMLESWDGPYTDALRREMNLAPFGATPRFDAYCKQGVLFSRFYAAGQRSMDGMSALLCGFPSLPHTPYLGRGMEQSRLSCLGQLAKQEGYETFFIQASRHNSFRCDAIAPRTGFDHYQGGEDIPPSPPAANRAMISGAAWDHEMFVESNRQLAAARKPFLAYLYTGTMHFPFNWPEEKWATRPPNSRLNRYLNSLNYVDDALAAFLDRAKADGWYDNTIFIMTADHIGGGGGEDTTEPAAIHHIPCLVLAPGLKPGVDRRVCGQLDVIPTIVDLGGWGVPYASLGRSLFDPDPKSNSAFCVQGDLILRVEEQGYVLHNFKSRVSGKAAGPAGELDAIERRLLSFVEVASTLLRENRICPE